MRSTCFTGDAPPSGATVAIGSSARGPSRSALEHPYGSFGYQYRGMGGVVSTAWDLWRRDRALRGDAVLAAESREALFAPGPGSYGLGWFVAGSGVPGDPRIQGHGGGVRGFTCDPRRYPDFDGALIVLCDSDSWPIGLIVAALERALLAEGDAADLDLAA